MAENPWLKDEQRWTHPVSEVHPDNEDLALAMEGDPDGEGGAWFDQLPIYELRDIVGNLIRGHEQAYQLIHMVMQDGVAAMKEPNSRTGAERIDVERRRQQLPEGTSSDAPGARPGEGYDIAHDVSSHPDESLALAACSYAIPDAWRKYKSDMLERKITVPTTWPWHRLDWKPTGDRVRDLEKAGALIAAEMDRILADERARDTERAFRKAVHGG